MTHVDQVQQLEGRESLRRPRPPLLSSIALGAYPLGGGYGAVSEEQARATVDAALDAGWTLFDTAETYLDSEERLGRILQGRRDRVFLATKAFPSEAYTRENLRASLDASLRRLGTDRVDLLQLHGPEDWVRPFGPTSLDEVGEALEELKASGKTVHVGVCNLPADGMAALETSTEIFSTQNLYSMIDRGEQPDDLHLPVETEIIPFARERGIAFLAYSPLSRGLLADGLDPGRTFGADDERHFLPRYQRGVFEQYVELAGRLSAWAHEHGRTLEQLAVAWTLSRPGVTASIVGAKSPEQVGAIGPADGWHLREAELAELDEILATLPSRAKEAKMVVWEHFREEALERLRLRRHGG